MYLFGRPSNPSMLPRFGASPVTGRVGATQRLFFEAEKVDALREAAEQGLRVLSEAEDAAMATALSTDLLSEAGADVERTTLGREAREDLEGRVKKLVRALSPWARRREAQLVLEYLVARYEALDFAADELLAACLPWHAEGILSPVARATRRWDFVVDGDKVPRSLLARRCVADASFVEVLCRVGIDAARMCDEHATTHSEGTLLSLYRDHFAVVTGTLCEALSLCRGKGREASKLARVVLPYVSDMLRGRQTTGGGNVVGARALRMSASCVVLALAAHAPSKAVIDAAVLEMAVGAVEDDGRRLRRTLCAAVVAKARLGARLGTEALDAFQKAPFFADAVRLVCADARNDAAARSVVRLLAPQLAARNDPLALALLDDIVAARLAVPVGNAALVAEACKLWGDKIDVRDVREDVLASLADDPHVAAARIRIDKHAPPTHLLSDPAVRDALEAVDARDILAIDSRDWALRGAREALENRDDMTRPMELLARHVDCWEVLDVVLRAAKRDFDYAAAAANLPKNNGFADVARAALLGDEVGVVAEEVGRQLAQHIDESSAWLFEKYLATAKSTDAAVVAAPKLARIGGPALDACLAKVAGDANLAECVVVAALGRLDDWAKATTPSPRLASCLAFFEATHSQNVVAWTLAHRGCTDELRRARHGACRLRRPDLVAWALACAGDKDDHVRHAAIAWLGALDHDRRAKFATRHAPLIFKGADQLAVAVRGHLDHDWFQLLLEPLQRRDDDDLDFALSLALLDNVFDKGGKQSALVAAWTLFDDDDDDTTSRVLDAALADLLAVGSSSKRSSGGGSKVVVGSSKKKTMKKMKAQNDPARMALLDILLKARLAASSRGGLALDDEVAGLLVAALSIPGSTEERSDAPPFLATWAQRETPGPRSNALEALATTTSKTALSEAREAELFGSILAMLRSDDVQNAPSRSATLAAARGLATSESTLARAWAGALRRPEADGAGFVADAAALVEVMAAARGASPPPAGAVVRCLFVALKRLLKVPTGVEADFARRQVLAELEAAANNHVVLQTADLDLVLEVAEADASDEAAKSLAAVVRAAPAAAVALAWHRVATTAADVAVATRRRQACHSVFAALVPALLAKKRHHKAPRLATIATHVARGLENDPSQDDNVDGRLTALSALARALDAVLATARGTAVVSLFVLAKRADFEAESRRSSADRARAVAEAIASRETRDTQLAVLATLAKAARRLAAPAFAVADPADDVVLSSADLGVEGDGQLDISVADLAPTKTTPVRLVVAAGALSLVTHCLAALTDGRQTQRAHYDRAREERRLTLCHELALAVALAHDDDSDLKLVNDDDDDDEVVLVSSSDGGDAEASAKVRLLRGFARALRRATRLLGVPSFIAFVQHLLGRAESKLVREAALAALHERLQLSQLFNVGESAEPTPFGRLVLEELTPFVGQTLAGDDSDVAVSLSAARAADILARHMAQRAPTPFAPLVEAAATAAVVAARSGRPSSGARARTMFSLMATLFATLRAKSLPVLAQALPRALDAVRSAATQSQVASRAGLRALLVVVASVPRFLHPHLASVIDILVDGDDGNDAEDGDDLLPRSVVESLPLDKPNDALVNVENDDVDASTTIRSVARALAAGVEPRLLLPALYAAHGRALAAPETPRRVASALAIVRPAVEALGRGAARAHAPELAAFALRALEGRASHAVETHAVELTFRLLLKLNEAELVDWLRAAAAWGLVEDDPDRRAAFFLVVATLVHRFRAIVASHAAAVVLEPALSELTPPAEPPAKRRKKDKRRASPQRHGVLAWRVVAALRLIFEYAPDAIDAERFDAFAPLLLDRIVEDTEDPTHAAFVDAVLAPCIAALAATTTDDVKHRTINNKLMLHARDGTLPTRLAALKATKALVTKLGHDVANFANHMVQAIAECLEDPATAPLARDVVALVDANAGIRIV